MVRTTFRRPPQSHVTSLGRRGYLGGAGLPSGAGTGQSMQRNGDGNGGAVAMDDETETL